MAQFSSQGLTYSFTFSWEISWAQSTGLHHVSGTGLASHGYQANDRADVDSIVGSIVGHWGKKQFLFKCYDSLNRYDSLGLMLGPTSCWGHSYTQMGFLTASGAGLEPCKHQATAEPMSTRLPKCHGQQRQLDSKAFCFTLLRLCGSVWLSIIHTV